MRIGIIGCGMIAQIMHIPYVAELPEVELYALCDPAERRVQTLADRYAVPHRFGRTHSLIADVGDKLDAAIVLTPPHAHADSVIQLLDEGIPTLVEKPLAVSVEDAEDMVVAAETADVTAMVAYMKRYDPAFERAQDELTEMDTIDLVTAYDVDPDHGRIIEEVYDLIDADLDASFLEESTRQQRADAVSAIGVEDDELATEYAAHLEHACHDINLLRGLFGDVANIDHVDRFADGRYATAHLRYEEETRCILNSGFSNRKWFEEWLRVDGPDRSVTIEYGNPFIRNTPTEVQVRQGTAEFSETTCVPTYDESFKREIRHFIRAVRGEVDVRTPFTDARDDVRLIADLFRVAHGVETFETYGEDD